jgi:hypothetical protein
MAIPFLQRSFLIPSAHPLVHGALFRMLAEGATAAIDGSAESR